MRVLAAAALLLLAGCQTDGEPRDADVEDEIDYGHYHGPHYHGHHYEHHHYHEQWQYGSSPGRVEVEVDPEAETLDPPAPPLTPPQATPEPLLPGL